VLVVRVPDLLASGAVVVVLGVPGLFAPRVAEASGRTEGTGGGEAGACAGVRAPGVPRLARGGRERLLRPEAPGRGGRRFVKGG
jgi:hypothetical protein